MLPRLSDLDKAAEYIDLVDGLVLSGGTDISPEFYGGQPEENLEIVPERDRWEIELFKIAWKRDLPVFGICRGMQLMNVALGGSLYRDINKELEKQLAHQPENEDYIHHRVNIVEGSRLHKILCSEEIEVNSHHHQAIKKLASLLRPAAVSEGGVVEAVEAPAKKFILGVQWHPEDLIDDKPCFTGAFKKLIENSG